MITKKPNKINPSSCMLLILTNIIVTITMRTLVVDAFTIQPINSRHNTHYPFLSNQCTSLKSLKASPSSIPEATTKEDEKEKEIFLPILQKALPSQKITSIQILNQIIQTGAIGTNLLVHYQDENDTQKKSTTKLFVKQIFASQFAGKSFSEMKRYLYYARTEVLCYKNVLPLFLKSGILQEGKKVAPACLYAELNLDGLIELEEHVFDETRKDFVPTKEELEGKGGTLVLESMDEQEYIQESPLTMEQSKQCLEAVAKLHAAAWQDVPLLTSMEEQLSKSAHHLRMRNPKELKEIVETWENFMESLLKKEAPELCQKESIQNLGKRVYDMAEYVSEQVTPKPTEEYATIAHGDFKAMNVFLPKNIDKKEGGEKGGGGAVMIDFASVGVGLGMSDVAMHIAHAIEPQNLKNGGEEELVLYYLDALSDALAQKQDTVFSYPKEVAMRHYRLASIDYFRFVLGRFWKGVKGREDFDKKKKNRNTTLVNRNVEAAIAFVTRVDQWLEEFEMELEEKQKKKED